MPEKQLNIFQSAKDATGSSEEAKLAAIADQWGVNLKKSAGRGKTVRAKFSQPFKICPVFQEAQVEELGRGYVIYSRRETYDPL